MKGRIRTCPKDNTYTLSNCCPVCKTHTITPHPFRFSPLDTYFKYRRLVR